MLERLVCGAESRCLGVNFDGPPKDQPLSPLKAEGVVSLVSGGVAWFELTDLRGAPNSYDARVSRTC